MGKTKITLIVGARPNYMKVAPLYRALLRDGGFQPMLVHTGQHFDKAMSQVFFDDLQMPRPDVYLNVGSATHAVQTAKVMMGIEPVLVEQRPEWLTVVGDVNSTVACALVAAKLHVPVMHVESGLRSFDRAMPEEINRVLTDQIADMLLTPSPDADENLLREGIDPRRIHRVGNIMIDSLRFYEGAADRSNVLETLCVEHNRYCLVTLHRPSNVDDAEALKPILTALGEIQKSIPVVFPVHPRTHKMLREHGLEAFISGMTNVRFVEPLGYLDFLKLQKCAKFVVTDSGGIQEETTALGVPCLTVRTSTERPITITEGTNILVGLDPARLVEEARKVLDGERKHGKIPDKWDGKTAERIIDLLHARQEP